MSAIKGKTQDSPAHPHRWLMAFTYMLTLAFVFGTASVVVAVTAWACVSGMGCAQFDGLSHVVIAWVGATISAVLGYLFGKRLL